MRAVRKHYPYAWPGSRRAVVSSLVLLLCACGGGSSGTSPPPPPPPPPIDANLVRVSADSPFSAGCNGAPQSGLDFVNAEVEPTVAISPVNAANLVGAWQQDRWSNGGSQGIVIAASFDGGHNWSIAEPPFSRCAGGTPGNNGDYERASDPWITVSPNGVFFAMALAFTGATLAPGSSNAMLTARSTDGGTTWGPVHALIADGPAFFNDKGSISADPTDANYAYAVWDRLSASNNGPTFFARTSDGGNSWQPANLIFDPGPGNQTLGNIVQVLPSGVLVNFFNEIDAVPGGGATNHLRLVRSTDHGDAWSAPVTIAELQSIGTLDPQTGTPVREGSDLFSVAVEPSGALDIVWQDSRFTSGAHDGIALSRSIDGGLTWSSPARVNARPDVAAFTPIVHVRADSVIGVSYFDFRSNTASSATLLTDYWLATTTDGVTFTETHVTGPFDLGLAPNADGLFLGDYQALTSSGAEFRPFFVKTTTAGAANRTDVYIAFGPGG